MPSTVGRRHVDVTTRVIVKDRGAKKVTKELRTAYKHPVIVGIIGESEAHDSGSGLTVAEVMSFHEFGLGVPMRSWLRAWIDENKEQITRVAATLQKEVIAGRLTERQASEQLGVWAEGQIKARISNGIEPALAESTIAQKGSSTPLIDTGQGRSAITHKVE